jgi:DUF4097 and DUF4098 domain-containing protein YvlB
VTGPQDRQDAPKDTPQDTPRVVPQDAGPGAAAGTADGTHTFEAGGPITLSVSLEFGTVRVHAQDTGTVTARIWAARTTRRVDVEAADRSRVHFADNALEIRVPGATRRFFGSPGSVDLDVVVPTGSSLRIDAGYAEVEITGRVDVCAVKTSYGDIRVDDTGRLDIDSQGGTVTTGRVAGPAKVSSTYGRIRIREAGGPADLATSSGDITVTRAAGDVTARSAYGQVTIGEQVRGSASVSGSYGAVTVGIPTGTAAYLDLRSDHGQVRSELDRTPEPRPDIERAAIRARTSYGDITIRRA